MKVERIEWLNEENKEGDVVVSDGEYKVLCFADGLEYMVGDIVKEPLNCLDVSNVMRSEEKEPMIQQNFDEYECFVRGQIFLEEDIVKVGGIKISITEDNYQKDIKNKEFVEMKISRIDIY